MSASESWNRLQEALRAAQASCAGDDRFTDDSTPAVELAGICQSCPILTECAEHARAAPRGSIYGVWAGLVRRAPRRYGRGSRTLTVEQVAKIEQLRREGLSIAVIADQVGVGTTTVQRRLRRLSEAVS